MLDAVSVQSFKIIKTGALVPENKDLLWHTKKV